MLNKSLVISFLSLLTSLISAINQIYLAKVYGSSLDLDFYLVVTSMPLFIAGTISASFSYYLTPLIIKIINNDKNTMNLSALSRIILTISILTFISGIISFFFFEKRLPEDIIPKAKLNILLVIIFAFFSIYNSFLTAVSNARNIINLPLVANMLPYIGMLIVIMFYGNKMGTPAISLGLSIGSVFTFLALLFINKNEILTKEKPKYKNAKQLFTFKLPLVFIGSFCFTCYQSIDSIVALKLGSASLSYVSYCIRLVVAISSIVIAGPSILITTYLANSQISESPKDGSKVIIQTLRVIFIISGSGAVFIIFHCKKIVEILFQRGSFTSKDTMHVAELLPFYIIGMIPMLFVVILFRALVAHDSLKQAAVLGIVSISVYTFGSATLSGYFGIIGIPISYIISWVLLFFLGSYFVFQETISTIFTKIFILKQVILLFFLTAICFYLNFFLQSLNVTDKYFYIFASAGLFGICFVVITYVLKFNETSIIFENIFIKAKKILNSNG